MNTDLIDQLNDKQKAAVTAPPENILVLAGAGSGKTRVLVNRIAWLISQHGVSPYSILAVTFTNKAANEMRGRIEEILSMPIRGMWVGTFHNTCHRLLRAHWEEAKLPKNFQILDSEDQQRTIARIQKEMQLDDSKWPARKTQWYINANKEQCKRAKDVSDDGTLFSQVMNRVYREYEAVCQRGGMVDFAELILRAYELLQQRSDILQHYQQRFQHALIDEFQDTNHIQYQLVKLLAGSHAKMMAVGDDDQSIYSWRGAQVENINRFVSDFADVMTIRLEQNYRSTQTILNAANAVISNNDNRMGKELWAQSEAGDPIHLYCAFNETDEARYIASIIQEQVAQGYNRREIAILYRSNAQSRILEDTLVSESIPYRIYGGLRFFERAEIKDAIAYLRLIANRDDDSAFERIVNTPTRGIGNTTLETLRECARSMNSSMWHACELLIANNKLTSRAAKAVSFFTELINKMDDQYSTLSLPEMVNRVIDASGLLHMYQKDRSEKGRSKVENLEEFCNATVPFENQEEDETLPPLNTFLSSIAMDAGGPQTEVQQDSVQLMTLHSAKGLEFPVVFISGLEDGLFPHKMSMDTPGRLEEERRLCYVGMTRAKTKLFLTYAEVRRLYGQEIYQKASRFIAEIPNEHIHEVRMRSVYSRPVSMGGHLNSTSSSLGSSKTFTRPSTHTGASIENSRFCIGQRVKHHKFGEGTIINYEGGSQSRIQVQFNAHGSKWLITAIAKLEPA